MERPRPHLPVGQRTIKGRVIKSVRGIHGAVSQAHVKDTLAGLESIGAIRKEGEPNRDGTLYRVLIPTKLRRVRREQTRLSTWRTLRSSGVQGRKRSRVWVTTPGG
jgi:hypothetical protein